MGKRGGKKHVKRLAFPTIIRLKEKKGYTWIARSSPGRHAKDASVPLLVILRDHLGFADTLREVKRMILDGKVMLDGRVAKDEHAPVGLFDVISFKDQDVSYRLIFDRTGKLIAQRLDAAEAAKSKVCKVINKFVMPKGGIGLTLHDGKTIPADNNVKVGDSVIVALPENKIKGIIRMQPGTKCYIYRGKHIGVEAVLEEIRAVKGASKQVKMKSGDEEFYTTLNYIMPLEEAK